MEKKTTQRIIGILVAVSFVIILLPLLFNKNDAATQSASIKAPPFPDQQAAPASSTVTITQEMANAINGEKVPAEPIAKPEANQQVALANTSPVPPQVAAAAEQQPAAPVATTADATQAPIAPLPAEAQAEPVKAIETQESAAPAIAEKTEEAKPAKTPAKKVHTAHAAKIKKHEHHEHQKTHAHAHKSISNLKKTAWAVQLGSFKDKNNARRLADRLRAGGYKAFMHDVKSARGNLQTRVYIGPELKQASASKLSTKLEQQMNLHGLVVVYKPLEL